MFDKLLLLCNGQTAYYGTPHDVIQFFEDIGMPCEEHYNPADFILEKTNSNKALQEEIVTKWSERVKNRKKSSYVIPETLHYKKDEGTFDATSGRTSSSKNVGLKNPAFEMESISGQATNGREAKNSTTVKNSEPENLQHTSCHDETATSRIEEIKATSDSAVNNSVNGQGTSVQGVEIDINNPVSETPEKTKTVFSPDDELHFSQNGVQCSIKQRSLSENIHLPDDETESSDDGDEEFGHVPTTWVTSFWTQFTVLCQRNIKETMPAILSPLNLIQTLGLAAIVSVVWFQTPYKESSINDRYAMLFFLTTYWSFSPLFEALLIFPSERVVVNKERASGYYRLSAYYLAKTVSELPLVLFQPTVFTSIIYWTTGLNISVAFLTTLIAVLTSTLTAQAMGFFLGATVMDFKKSLVIAALFVMASMLLGGLYQQNLPTWLDWAKYLSFIAYSFGAIVFSEFKTSPSFTCNKPVSSYEVCQKNGTVIQGTDVLQHFNVERSFWTNIAILVAIMATLRVLTYLVLRYLRRPK